MKDDSQGVQLDTIRKLAKYWGTVYDYRKGEAKLNAFPHFITEIDGLDIYFIHVKSKLPNGRHFASWEQPRYVVSEMRASFRSLR